MTAHFDCRTTDKLSVFCHLSLTNLKQLDNLQIIAMCIIYYIKCFFPSIRLCGTEIWDYSKGSKKLDDNKDQQHHQVLQAAKSC